MVLHVYKGKEYHSDEELEKALARDKPKPIIKEEVKVLEAKPQKSSKK